MSTNTTDPPINNLADFLAMMEASTPYRAGRTLYKGVDCGPWLSFTIQDKAPFTRCATLAVGLKDGKLAVVNREEGLLPEDDPNEADLRRLGFAPDGTVKPRSSLPRSLKGYRKEAEAYVSLTATRRFQQSDSWLAKVHAGHPHSGEPSPRHVWISISEEVPAATHEVYYESEEANNPMLPNCVGVSVGSIVEGSDAEIGPESLSFPFTRAEFWQMVENINSEACAAWHEANDD